MIAAVYRSVPAGAETRGHYGRTERVVFRRNPKIRECQLLYVIAIAGKCVEAEGS
jgi:hypothetical protein